jgi:hypothetical protein
VILNALPVQMPRDVVRYLMHDSRHVAAAAAHVLATLHADAVKARRAPGVSVPAMLRDDGAGHLVAIANCFD